MNAAKCPKASPSTPSSRLASVSNPHRGAICGLWSESNGIAIWQMAASSIRPQRSDPHRAGSVHHRTQPFPLAYLPTGAVRNSWLCVARSMGWRPDASDSLARDVPASIALSTRGGGPAESRRRASGAVGLVQVRRQHLVGQHASEEAPTASIQVVVVGEESIREPRPVVDELG